MKVLIIDQDRCGLALAMRAQDAGHDVQLWMPKDKGTARPCPIGQGLVPIARNWEPAIHKADLVILTENSKYVDDLEVYFRKGYPIFGCNREAGLLELDREVGQDAFKSVGMQVLPYETFASYDKAIAYVEKENRPFVSKPWGGNPDKSLSYVPKRACDLVARLENWKKMKLKGSFMLQEMVDGFEMAVGGWFGPGGWSGLINENWEEKRLMCGGLGPNTGEMGTVMRYVTESKLFDDVCRPLEPLLRKLKYVGYVDVNCMVDTEGTPWPLEATMRFGWPHWNLCMHLHQGDPVSWMADLREGRDSLKASKDICVGVVMSMGHFPWDDDPIEVEGWAIHGMTTKNSGAVYLSGAMMAEAPIEVGGKIKRANAVCSAGNYVLIACGAGKTVMAAQKDCYRTVEDLSWAPHRIYRTDIGARLEEDLLCLQDFGYAKGMKFK